MVSIIPPKISNLGGLDVEFGQNTLLPFESLRQVGDSILLAARHEEGEGGIGGMSGFVEREYAWTSVKAKSA